MTRGVKRWRVEFQKTGASYELEAPSRQTALILGYRKLQEEGLVPADANAVEDFKATAYCLDEPPPTSKYDGRGMLRKPAPGKRHPAPQVSGGKGPPAPALRPGMKGRIKGST